MKFLYTIEGPDKVVFEKGDVWGITVYQAVMKLEKKFKKDVLENGVKLAVSLFRKSECVYSQKYESRRDFRIARLADFRRRFGLFNKGGSPNPRYWFIAVKKTGELVPTKLCYDLSKRTWLSNRKKRLIGPYLTYEAMNTVINDIEQIRSLTSDLILNDRREYGRGRKGRKRWLIKTNDSVGERRPSERTIS